MAKNISLAGAVFPDVPSILLPQQGGGMVSYVDVTGTTAVASDVAQGKKFYTANGIETTGTASGGGGGTPTLGALRPDAELVQRYTYDKLLVQDEGVTIPSYTTTATTLKANATIGTLSVDISNYRYIITERMLALPIYSTATKAKGRAEYFMSAYVYEDVYIPNGERIGSGEIASSVNAVLSTYRYNFLYWQSATVYGIAASQNGAFMVPSNPTMGSTSITVKSPDFRIKGNTNYYNSTYWNYTTDIRGQYIIEVWRVPNTPIYGYEVGSLVHKMIDDINNGGTLT